MPNGTQLTPETFRIIENEGVDGIIVSAGGVESVLTEIAKTKIPVVLIGLSFFPRTTDVAFVHTDEKSIGSEAALFFLRDAHWSTIGYVHSDFRNNGWDDDRARSFRTTLAKHSVNCVEFPDGECRRSSANLATWLRVIPKPAAILAAEDYCAYDILNACKASGLRIPQDIVVLGVGNTVAICENAMPALSSVEPDYDLEGYLAAKHLDGIMSAAHPMKAEHVYCGVKRIITRGSAPGMNPRAGLLVQKALVFIRENVCRGIGAHDVVKYLRVSRALADQRFREVLDKSILNVILDARLERTKLALLDTDESIAAVCMRCGWKSENHPKKLFQKKYGMTMREYRNVNKNGDDG